ncbi:hypothetical protein BDR06DRAFT_1006517 [Suillus hirtellus]|nr:hypothetical protein BDR06DRAFT_1006517 [Suillus hirtellus]
MPVIQPPRPRRSAHLKVLQCLSLKDFNIVEPPQGPVTCGRGVIEHLLAHPADCCLLFYSDGKQTNIEGEWPSGKDKLSVCAVIARHVFQHNSEYATRYVNMPDKFHDSTNNHISRKKYCDCYDQLHATGTGVMPEDDTQNLHAQILDGFPWYDDLASILGANPVLSLKTVSFRPGVDHAANYFQILRTAGSTYLQSLHSDSAQYGGTTDTHTPPHAAPPHAAPPHVAPPHIAPPYTAPPCATTYAGAGYSAGATYDGDADCDNGNADRDDDITMDDGWRDDPNVIILNSPPRPQPSTKRPLPALPPSPPPRSEFALPEKMQTDQYNSHASFGRSISGRHTNLGHMRCNSGGSSSSSRSKAASSPVSITPMSEPIPSSSKGKGWQVKKQRSDLQSQAQSQMEALTDGIESVQSD